jgi:hypothetical protein
MHTDKHIVRYRKLYRMLLTLYPKHYRNRYGESMEQTFHDVCREQHSAGKRVLSTVLWMFIETTTRIIRENTAMIVAHDFGRRLLVWAAVVGCILMIPLVAMQFTTEVNWTFGDFMAMGILLYGCACIYEFIAMQGGVMYRVAVGIGVVTAFLLIWINLAVGIIGSEDNPANALYLGVIIIGMLGAALSRMKARGLSITLWIVAAYQFVVPFIALAIWHPQAISADEGPGVVGVIALNTIIASMFTVSGILFRNSRRDTSADASRDTSSERASA